MMERVRKSRSKGSDDPSLEDCRRANARSSSSNLNLKSRLSSESGFFTNGKDWVVHVKLIQNNEIRSQI